MIHLVADHNIPFLSDYVPEGVELTLFDPDGGLPTPLANAHALIVRTVTPINQQSLTPFLPAKSLSFIGTASAGFDHIDSSYLAERGITFTNAAGCNSRAVAEFVASALLHLFPTTLAGQRVGVVGVGNAGGATADLLERLGCHVLRYDPPRELRDSSFTSCTLDDVLQADILSFHTPLSLPENAPPTHATMRWMNARKFNQTCAHTIINASRGGVVDEAALINAFESRQIRHIITDVWENEPQFNGKLAQISYLATPHIAGYSIQAKRNATRLTMEAFCTHFRLPLPLPTPMQESDASDALAPPQQEMANFDASSQRHSLSIAQLLERLHPMFSASVQLKTGANAGNHEKTALFRRLRTEGHLRQEYTSMKLPKLLLELHTELGVLCESSSKVKP